ncbi:MAG: nitrous oxide reductase accessory protein NosL [Armatimonadota bacterium]|nr:nitrous oxide reductase accessory protein NosL [Armatimonadota bacterium]
MRRAAIGIGVVLILTLGGALVLFGQVAPPERIPLIQEGVDRCALCNMVIRDARHGAVVVTAAGQFRFDDLGCLFNYIHAHGLAEKEVRSVLVRDWRTQGWIEGRSAFFVSTSQRTPMTYGLFAFRKAEDARAFAKAHGGKVLSFQEAMKYAVERRKMMKGMQH